MTVIRHFKKFDQNFESCNIFCQLELCLGSIALACCLTPWRILASASPLRLRSSWPACAWNISPDNLGKRGAGYHYLCYYQKPRKLVTPFKFTKDPPTILLINLIKFRFSTCVTSRPTLEVRTGGNVNSAAQLQSSPKVRTGGNVNRAPLSHSHLPKSALAVTLSEHRSVTVISQSCFSRLDSTTN